MDVEDVSGPEFEVRVADWLDWEDATERVLASAVPLPGEGVPLGNVVGRALAEDVAATATLPPWDNSAMDGYAARASEVQAASPSHPVALTVIGLLRAGDVPTMTVGPGEAVRIMTGAPIPSGADSVVRVEHTDAEDTPGQVRILHGSDAGRNIRPGGQDMGVGDRVLEAGASIDPGTVGVLAALGLAEAWVHSAPVVALVSTGDELRGPDRYEDVREGRGVPESNGPMLAAAVRTIGGDARLLEVAPDDPAVLGARLEEAREADVVVTLGGASMGEADLVKRVLDGLGYEQDFWRVTIRPGSPFSFGHLPHEGRRVPVFGLPGNPASAFVTFELFVRPFLLRTGGHRRVHRRLIRGRAAVDIHGPPGKTHFPRVCLEGSDPLLVRPAGPQGSGLVRGLADADGLAVVPKEVDGIAEGDPVDVFLLR